MKIEILGECAITSARVDECIADAARAIAKYDMETLRLTINLLVEAVRERDEWIDRLGKMVMDGEQ